MDRRTSSGVIACIALACASCGPALLWKPRTESADHYTQTRQTTRRSERKDVRDCEEIGMVLADGTPEGGLMDAISREAAKHGGTHYVVKDDETDRYLVVVRESGKPVGVTEGDRHVATIIFRCP